MYISENGETQHPLMSTLFIQSTQQHTFFDNKGNICWSLTPQTFYDDCLSVKFRFKSYTKGPTTDFFLFSDV